MGQKKVERRKELDRKRHRRQQRLRQRVCEAKAVAQQSPDNTNVISEGKNLTRLFSKEVTSTQSVAQMKVVERTENSVFRQSGVETKNIQYEEHAMNQEHIHVSTEEAIIAGVDPKNKVGMERIKLDLEKWDYDNPADANIAYSSNNPNIARLQLLRQIKPLLFDRMGFSNDLYDKLTTGDNPKFKPVREAAQAVARAEGYKLQAWRGLKKSAVLREFVGRKEFSSYLAGYVDENDKWRKKHKE